MSKGITAMSGRFQSRPTPSPGTPGEGWGEGPFQARHPPTSTNGKIKGDTTAGSSATKCSRYPDAYALFSAYGHSCRSHISQCQFPGRCADIESEYTGRPYSRQPA